MKLLKYIALIGAVCAAFTMQLAKAELIFPFTSDHVTGGAGTPPFGSVTLTQDGTSVDFNVTLAAGYSFVETGSADGQLFKFNATGVLVTDITVTQNFPGFTLIADTGAFNGDGTGNFSFGITTVPPINGGSNPDTNPILFSVANSVISDFTTANNLGFVFVADILAPNGNTGPVDASVGHVPDSGATAMLLGLGLSGLGFVRRFVKR